MFSNFNVGQLDAPYDCNITIQEQLNQAYQLGLDVIFVTNHNTLDGYRQMLEYKNNHKKFENIQVFPAEEITTSDDCHVLVYGINDVIGLGLSLDEVLEEVRRQNAISSAPHPFGLLDALRENAIKCDLIEVFNSNNVDIFANTKATIFATRHNMTGVAGSDSHVISTLGRCTNIIESEIKLDDVLSSMRHRKIRINQTGYATAKETLEHLSYKIDNSKEYIHEYLSQFYPKSKAFFSLLLKLFEYSPNSILWMLFYKFALFAMKRISKKINFQNLDPHFLKERNISTMFMTAF